MVLNGEQQMVDALRRAGFKITPQRHAIVRCLCGDDTHPTPQELYGRLQPTFPTMSFATVYNTLSALVASGGCRQLHIGGAARFDPNMTPHHHTVCERCGAMRDIVVDVDEKESPPVVDGFQIHHVERIYRGVCARCGAAAPVENIS